MLKLAAGQGLEPQYSPPKGDVLPLDEPAMQAYRIQEKHTFFNLNHHPFQSFVHSHECANKGSKCRFAHYKRDIIYTRTGFLSLAIL